MNKHRGQISLVTLATFLILFFITAAFMPVIGSFTGYVTSNTDVASSGRDLWGLIPAAIGIGLLMSLFAYAQRRQ